MWEDEDRQEAEVDNWEDELEEQPEEPTKQPQEVQPKRLTKKQRQRLEEEKRKKAKEEREAFEKDKEAQKKKKEEERRAVEEADHALTAELFDGVGESDNEQEDEKEDAKQASKPRGDYDEVDAYDMMGGDPDSDGEGEEESVTTSMAKSSLSGETSAASEATLPPPDVTTSIQALNLDADKDFKQLAHEIASCFKAKDNRKVGVFLKELTASLTESWSFEEFNGYYQSVTVISNSKKKNTGKKKKKAGAVVKVDKSGSAKAYDNYEYDEYGDFM